MPLLPTSLAPEAPSDRFAAVRLLARTGRGIDPVAVVPRPPFAWKTRVLLPAALIVGFCGAFIYAARDVLWPATPVRVVPVVVTTATGTGNVAGMVTVQAPGWVEADPYAVAVTALADGVIEEILVLEGESVQAGQVVARLIDDDAQLALSKAAADLAQRHAVLKAAQDAWDNPVERTRAVAAATGLTEQTRAELHMLQSEILAAVAKTEEARYENDRLAKAFEGSAATPFEAMLARQKLAAAEATLEATRRRKNVLDQQLAQAQAELAAAKDNQRLRIEESRALAEARAAADLAAASHEEARLRLDRMEVRSPVDGVVMSRLVNPGSKVGLAMDDPLSAVVVRVYDPQKLQVRVDVPLADAAKVSIGQGAEVTVSKFVDRVFEARVTRRVPEADIQKNTQQFKLAIIDPDPGLAPEMLARAKFLAAAPATATGTRGGTQVFAPDSLLKRDPASGKATAWVVDPVGSTATRRTVEIGNGRRGDWVSISQGLAVGDRLIAEPADLSEGQKIRIAGEASLQETNTTNAKEVGYGVH